ncbi:MAG: bifunctional folylpolyglutamate synthase/dihydrofolate synthase [Chloroflexi bacterium]|nr:bifunctional folylpolyglutamate synthase/dihydrofolate synthase [Chloroflexota bacterium]
MATFRQALDYIYSFTNFEVTLAGDYTSKTFDLDRMRRLLGELGNPQTQFGSVHIAGTKGKGSTAAMIESVLRAAGHRTGLYTSPHLHSFRERIRVDGEMISRDDVAAGVLRLQPVAGEIPGLTTFEIMTALAFDYFQRRSVEVAVLEVGLGGRLDATNVVQPLVSVITSISLDHTAILGDNVEEIALEKAGIVKAGVPIVSSPQSEGVAAVIEKVAATRDAPLISISPDLDFDVSDTAFRIDPAGESPERQSLVMTRQPEAFDMTFTELELELPLVGPHQRANAATALAALMVLRDLHISVPDHAIRRGLSNVSWPGRFQVLGRDPFVVVDGAHNGDSMRRLIETLDGVFPQARWCFVFGASGDKDIAAMLAEIGMRASALVLTTSHNPRAATPARLTEIAANCDVRSTTAPDIPSAIREARASAGRDGVVCITGSLFVVAEAQQALADGPIATDRD